MVTASRTSVTALKIPRSTYAALLPPAPPTSPAHVCILGLSFSGLGLASRLWQTTSDRLSRRCIKHSSRVKAPTPLCSLLRPASIR